MYLQKTRNVRININTPTNDKYNIKEYISPTTTLLIDCTILNWTKSDKAMAIDDVYKNNLNSLNNEWSKVFPVFLSSILYNSWLNFDVPKKDKAVIENPMPIERNVKTPVKSIPL